MLRTFEVSAEIFDKILYDFSAVTESTDDIHQYCYGYKNRKTIYYTREYLICREYILDYYCHNVECPTDWKQVQLRRVENAKTAVEDSVTGNYAWNYLMSYIRKKYTDEEIDKIFRSYEAEYSEAYKQNHYNFMGESGVVHKFENCYKYDVNGAHCQAVCDFFPRCHDEFMAMYNKRKTQPKYKKFFNFFVGELCRKGYRKTYNWIVQRTTKKLFKAMDEVDGQVLYSNTDGFLVTNTKKELKTSMNLGDFKLEFKGTAYMYISGNYLLYQFGEEKVGSCMNEVRPEIDLRKGIVVDYRRQLESLGKDKNGRPRYYYRAIDKKIKQVRIV